MQSTPKTSAGKHSSECNKADIDWYVRMPTNPLQVNPNGKMLLALGEGEDAILEPISPKTDNWL